MCFIVCVLFLFFSDFLFFSLMIGKTFVMFGYANKEFEFEFEFVMGACDWIGVMGLICRGMP